MDRCQHGHAANGDETQLLLSYLGDHNDASCLRLERQFQTNLDRHGELHHESTTHLYQLRHQYHAHRLIHALLMAKAVGRLLFRATHDIANKHSSKHKGNDEDER